MLVFRNPGLIDLEAVRTLGVSVKQPGSFGRFGTGLKFAIATILRGGGEITIYRGTERHMIGTIGREIRGTVFQIVTLDGEQIGITTTLGRDWEPWMVLRELGCNALDEGGEFYLASDENSIIADPVDWDHTTIAVRWADLETAYKQRKELFLEDEPIWANDKLRILPGASAHLFYRGIRVLKLPKPSLFTFDVLEEQSLTEDRTLHGSWQVDDIIRDAMMTMEDKTIIGQVLSVHDGYHEAKLDFGDTRTKPSRAFLNVAIDLREGRKSLNPTAKKMVLRHSRDMAEEESYGGSYKRLVNDTFAYIIEQLAAIGIKFADDQKFIVLEELGGPETKTMIENGRIYILQSLMDEGARALALELIARWCDLKEAYGSEEVVRLLAPLLLGKAPSLKDDEQLTKEDAAIEAILRDTAGVPQEMPF